jgi:hypothetical protein
VATLVLDPKASEFVEPGAQSFVEPLATILVLKPQEPVRFLPSA